MSWLDRLSKHVERRSKARLFLTLSALFLVVTPGAVLLVFYESSESADPDAFRLEAIIGASLIALHLLFILMTWMFWDSPEETSAPEDDPDSPR